MQASSEAGPLHLTPPLLLYSHQKYKYFSQPSPCSAPVASTIPPTDQWSIMPLVHHIGDLIRADQLGLLPDDELLGRPVDHEVG